MSKALLLFVSLATVAFGATIDYRTLGTFNTPSLNTGGVTVTGSANVNVQNFTGLGILGGDSNFVDGSEYIELFFNSGPATSVSYFVFIASNGDSDGLVGERFLEAFNSQGTSLGTVVENGSGTFLVSSLFGDTPISRFRLTADVDRFLLSSVTFTESAAVPEPATYWLLACGLVVIFYLRKTRSIGNRLASLWENGIG